MFFRKYSSSQAFPFSDSSLSTRLCDFYKIEWLCSGVCDALSVGRLDSKLENSQNRDFCVGFGCLLNLVFKCLNIPTYYSYQLNLLFQKETQRRVLPRISNIFIIIGNYHKWTNFEVQTTKSGRSKTTKSGRSKTPKSGRSSKVDGPKDEKSFH